MHQHRFETHRCLACRKMITERVTSGRQRRYCSDACRQAAYRDRRADPDGWRRRTETERRNQSRLRRDALIKARNDAALDAWVKSQLVNWDREERLLRDETMRKLLVKAMATDSESEAANALALARRRFQASLAGP